MNDEETFIRSLLENPGDDAPRMIYADWLDERSDPRGELLRSEIEWQHLGQKARSAQITQIEQRIREIESVWVARVCRPPFGVCSPWIRISDRGPNISKSELEALSTRLRVRLHPQCMAFLLNWNGGIPDARQFRHITWADDEYAEIGRFMSVYPPNVGPPSFDRFLDDLEQSARMLKGGGYPFHVIADWLPIANSDNGDVLLLGTADSNFGQIAFFRDYVHNSDDANYLFPVDDALSSFLTRLARIKGK